MNLYRFFILLIMTTNAWCQHFKIESLTEILKTHPEIEYIKCHDAKHFYYEPFPISKFPELQPNQGLFAETFILKIPNGQVCSYPGWIKINNSIIKELFPQSHDQKTILKHLLNPSFSPFINLKKVSGKVAVITNINSFCYGHWMLEILGRLALLELHDIKYDWLYISSHYPFQKETLALWGIDTKKLIEPLCDYYIQADELIVPSYTAHRTPEEGISFYEHVTLVCYCKPWIIEYMRNKFLPLAELLESRHDYNFSKRIFISRQKTKLRKIINEDEVFSVLEPQGFTRYYIEFMSVLEQIILFKNAEIIVSPNGSGLTNIIFCKPETQIVEIFQARSDCCFYYLAQNVGLKNYQYIKTMEFEDIEGVRDTYVPQNIISFLTTKNFWNKKP